MLLSIKKAIVKKGYALIIAINLCILIYISYRSIFNIYESDKNFPLAPAILILGTIVYIAFFYKIKKLLASMVISPAKLIIIGLSICTVYFVLLCILANRLTVLPQVDLVYIQKEVLNMIENGGSFTNVAYFSRYPQQQVTAIILYYAYKVSVFFGFHDISLVCGVLNSFLIALSAFGCFCFVKINFSAADALLVLLIFIVNPIFYLFSSYSYTDTLCMPFTIWGIYFFVAFFKGPEYRRSGYLFVGIFLLLVGTKIRATTIIVLIALIMWGIVQYKYKLLLTSVLIAAAVLLSIGWNGLKSHHDYPNDRTEKFPIEHYIMMGTNYEREGRYSNEDYNYTLGFESYEEKVEGNRAKILQRLTEMGPHGIVKLLAGKLSVVWSNGDCTQNTWNSVKTYGSFYDYTIGSKSIFFRYFIQINRCALLIVILYFMIHELLLRKRELFWETIALFGAFLFYLIWETKRRYSLSFLPWMFFLMVYGFQRMQYAPMTNALQVSNNYISLSVIKKRISQAIITLSALLLLANWNRYTKEENIYTDPIINQTVNDKGRIKNFDHVEVEQTFLTKQKFNYLSLKFIKNKNLNAQNQYSLSLVDIDKGKILYRQVFMAEEIAKDGKISFSFPTVNPHQNTHYKIVISPNSENKEGGLGIQAYQSYDLMPSGQLYIDGAPKEADLQFSVYYRRKRPYTSKRFYILCMVIILGTECFSLLGRKQKIG